MFKSLVRNGFGLSLAYLDLKYEEDKCKECKKQKGKK